jgi:hypothetical protein
MPALSSVVVADNIATGEVLDTPAQEETELRLQLVASPENLPKTLYNPDDMCALAKVHVCPV